MLVCGLSSTQGNGPSSGDANVSVSPWSSAVSGPRLDHRAKVVAILFEHRRRGREAVAVARIDGFWDRMSGERLQDIVACVRAMLPVFLGVIVAVLRVDGTFRELEGGAFEHHCVTEETTCA